VCFLPEIQVILTGTLERAADAAAWPGKAGAKGLRTEAGPGLA
jgi:hypothetical protein